MDYFSKYIKYKNKYKKLLLKRQFGGNLKTMPQLCFGTAQHDLMKTLPIALKNNIIHIDGAECYGGGNTHKIINECIKKIPRETLWITWKDDNISVEKIKLIIQKLGCTYIDTFLVHHDYNCTSEDDFIQLKIAQDEKLIRFYGISNCEKIDRLKYLKERYNISTIQIQARPPKGKIQNRGVLSDNFIEQCNEIGINVMLFASISAIINLDDYSSIYDNINNINKYYLQKYCNNTNNNVLIISSINGTNMLNTIIDFEKFQKGEPLLNPDKIIEIEKELEKLNLNFQ